MIDILTETYQEIIETIADGIRILDKDGNIAYANDAYCKLLGYEPGELTGKTIYELFPPEDRPLVEKRLQEREAGKKSRHEVRYEDKNNKTLFLEILATPIFDKNDEYKGSYAVIFDITERKELEGELKKEKDFLNSLVSLCPDSIIGVNREGEIVIFNQAAEALTGLKAEDVVGKMSIRDIYHTPELARMVKKYLYSPEFGELGRLQGYEVELADHSGREIPIRLSATLLYKDGQEIGSVGFFHDLTTRKQMEAKLRELSVTDSLSGLFNQRHFYAVLSKEIERAGRYGRPLSLICFDLDNFKQCNDQLGHLEGDNIIRMVGQVLKENLRQSDHAFRYGGDEFMVLLPESDLKSARVSADRIRNAFNSLWSVSFLCKNEVLNPVTLSVGIAEIAPEETSQIFIKRADLAMYEAKRAGGDQAVEARVQIGKSQNCLCR